MKLKTEESTKQKIILFFLPRPLTSISRLARPAPTISLQLLMTNWTMVLLRAWLGYLDRIRGKSTTIP